MEVLSDYLVPYSGQKSQQIAGKKIQMPSEIKLLAGTKIYYCFNSKGDNFKVNQLYNAAKTNYTSETECLAVFLMCDRWPLK